MFKRFCVFLCVLLMIPCTSYAYEISAASAVVMDAGSGEVLYSKNIDSQRPMASTTKLMTCLLACESGKLNDTVVITEEMLYGTEGSMIYIKAGDRITLSDLVCGAMLASGNDAANAIAVYLSGSVKVFLEIMNQRATEIGMLHTKFVTPSGLDKSGHKSTAYDMALLAAQAVQNTELLKLAGLTACEITISGKTQTIYNHNKLLSCDKNYIGLKTGYTKKAGRCLVSAYKYGGSIIICVTLSAPDDWNDHKRLVSRAKKCYKRISKTNTVSINTVGAQKSTVNAEYSFSCCCIDGYNIREYYYPFVYAPVSAGQIVGRAEVYIGKTLVYTADIKTTEGILQWQITK